MRKLVILRGAQGSGKSTFVIEQKLDAYVISSDSIRLILGSVLMSPEGNMMINHDHENKVWSLIDEILEKRMSRGEFIVFDATFQRTRDFHKIMQRARLYRYEIICIDFSDVPLEVALTRNKSRIEYRRLSDHLIELAYKNIINEEVPQGILVFPSKIFENKSLINFLDIKKINLNQYKKIHHIGDIQGCFQPLATYFKDGFKHDEFYIFVGDYLDRGIENDLVMQFILEQVMHLPNVVLIWGNHETHIHRFALGEKAVSKEFSDETLPQLMKINFSKNQAEQLCKKLVDCFVYEYAGYSCFVSHAGISKVPEHPILLPSMQYWKGTGAYEYPVDEVFSLLMKDTNWFQVHGHRNKNCLPVQASEKSFNLEGKVEFGGHLRIMILNENGIIQIQEVQNHIYRKQNLEKDKDSADEFGKLSEKAKDNLASSKYVSIKKFETYPHISSYVFKPSMFFQKAWNHVLVKARGLFVDNNRRIIARGYNKFFNIGEIQQTMLDNLALKFKFPLSVYVKENGYLALVGYDEQTDQLFITSKSDPESIHTGYFKEILMQQINNDSLALLKNYLREHNVNLVFEVIDIIHDPHIIEYKATKLVLLDILFRTELLACVSYLELQKVALQYGFECKKRAMQFQDWDSFDQWYQSVQKKGKNYIFQGQHIEGFVIQDNEGYLCKIKLPYYNFWRHMRTIRDQVIEMRQSGKPIKADIHDTHASAFYYWIVQQPDTVLSESIISLRTMYLKDHQDITE